LTWNPLRTLAGRMVLVTVVAVAISYAAAFLWFFNERGSALRRAAETTVIERIAYTAERVRATPPDRRAAVAAAVRDYGIRYTVDPAPAIAASGSGAGTRVARGLSERLNGVDVRGQGRDIEVQSRRWRPLDDDRPPRDAFEDGRDPNRGRARDDRPARDAPTLVLTEVTVSIAMSNGQWLNARVRLPGTPPAPLSVLIGALVSVIAVGVGAALISRQIGRPLANLAAAAQALGSGQANVTVPLSGPEDVRRASTAFNAMAERLGRQLNRQRQMLWALSHDLRTPITALRLRAELVEDDAARARLLGPLEEMERLTEQALSLARAGASEETRARIDLSDLARTLCGELQDMGISATAETDAPVMVECRPSEIARALRNMAENAAKYGGGGVMRVSRAPSREVIVEVTDDGPGVPPEQLSKLAEPFFRADQARSGENGAGLGLAIAQAIADGHGGRLVLANRAPRGFSAKLILPG
jgi:signal transduction histidine kinase